MPTYEYECTECGDNFDVFMKMSDKSLEKCTKCGGLLRKVFSPVGIVFKGSGFYKTDSRKNSEAKSTPASNGTAVKTGTSESAGTVSSAASSAKSDTSTSTTPTT